MGQEASGRGRQEQRPRPQPGPAWLESSEPELERRGALAPGRGKQWGPGALSPRRTPGGHVEGRPEE